MLDCLLCRLTVVGWDGSCRCLIACDVIHLKHLFNVLPFPLFLSCKLCVVWAVVSLRFVDMPAVRVWCACELLVIIRHSGVIGVSSFLSRLVTAVDFEIEFCPLISCHPSTCTAVHGDPGLLFFFFLYPVYSFPFKLTRYIAHIIYRRVDAIVTKCHSFFRKDDVILFKFSSVLFRLKV